MVAPKDLSAAKPETIYRKDYTPTPYLIETVYLNFLLDEAATRVVAKSVLRPNPGEPAGQALSLDGTYFCHYLLVFSLTALYYYCCTQSIIHSMKIKSCVDFYYR